MFQLQTRTTGISLRLAISLYYQLKQKQHTEAEGSAELLGEDTCEETVLFQAFHISWTCCGSAHTLCLFMHQERYGEAAAALLSLLHVLGPLFPYWKSAIWWIPWSWPRKK